MADATCEKCDQYYDDPRMLPCLHSFCLGCLEKELETQTSLYCPNCKEKVTLAENGVAGLPQDLHLANEAEIARISEKVEDADELCQACGRTDSTGKAVAYCIECKEYLCKGCEGRHGKREVMASHNLVTVGERVKTNEANPMSRFYQKKMYCPFHKTYALEVYCKQCKQIICKNCMDFEHRQHRDECHLIEAVAKQEREALKACQGDTNGAVTTLNTAIAKCKETMEQVDARKKAVDTSITQSLDQVRNALLGQNAKLHLSKMASLEAQVNKLQRVRGGLASVSTMIDEAQTHSPAQLLATKNVLAERATKLQKEFQESNLPPCQSANFVTDISDPATISKMVSLGCVSGGGHPPTSTCNAGYLPRAVIGKPRSIKVTAIDRGKKEVGKGGDDVAAKLVPLGSPEKATDGETSDNGDGTYTVTITPQSTGEHDLHVTLANGHVKGSPFRLYSITKPRETPYTSVTNQNYFGTYNYPNDVAMTGDGGFAVAEYGYQTVSLYSANGTRIHSFGKANSYGSEDGQFYSPSGVAIKGDIMYVCECNNHRVQKFSLSKRSFISKFGRNGSGDGEFSSPYGICIDSEGRVFVSDYGNHCIQVFDGNDQFLYSFPCQQTPWGLAFDLEGHLHVAACGSNCIHVFTPEGSPITSYGTGTLNVPAGIAIDGQGYIAISETGGSNRLWIYSPDRNLVHTLSGLFSCGRGIACDKDGSFLVACYNNHQVKKFF